MNEVERERHVFELFEAMLDVPPGEQLDWLTEKASGDKELVRRVTRLAHIDNPQLIRTGGAVDFDETVPPPEMVNGYRLGGLIGSGGMGSVYAATRERGDFAHDVAIKLIKPGAFSHRLTDRFLGERALLAQFKHRHIAQLYDGGETEDGQPYFIMERIQGMPLDGWIESRVPPAHRRYRLFAQICDAVGYAHRNLVIHRDLTPSNVLVDAEDDAKLIDFGIAQPSDEGSEALATPAIDPGTWTPGYTAPERKAGHAATTLSDIYSVGRLLALLFPSPRDRELEAIVAQATATDPAARYPTIDALAADVAAYRSASPVAAMAPTRRYHLRKFIQRYRVQSALGAAFLLAVIIGLAAASFFWREAASARDEAEARFGELRSLADTMMFEVFDEVARVPGTEKARARLASTSLIYLDRLAKDKRASSELRLDVAKGYLRLAKTVGSTSGSTLGRLTEGRDLAATGVALLEDLYRENPTSPTIRFALAEALGAQSGEDLMTAGDVARAREKASRAMQLIEALSPQTAMEAATLIDIYRRRGQIYAWENQTDRAALMFQEGFVRYRDLKPPLGESMEVQRQAAFLYSNAADALASKGELGAAMETYRAGYAFVSQLNARPDATPLDLRTQVIYLSTMGKIAALAGDPAEALENTEQALAVVRNALAQNPDDTGFKLLFASTGLTEAMLRARAGDRQAALDLAAEAMRYSAETVRVAGETGGALMVYATRLHEAAQVRMAAGAKLQACRDMKEAVSIMQDFARKQPLPESSRSANLNPMLQTLKTCPAR